MCNCTLAWVCCEGSSAAGQWPLGLRPAGRQRGRCPVIPVQRCRTSPRVTNQRQLSPSLGVGSLSQLCRGERARGSRPALQSRTASFSSSSLNYLRAKQIAFCRDTELTLCKVLPKREMAVVMWDTVRILPAGQCLRLPCLLLRTRLANSDPSYTHSRGAGVPPQHRHRAPHPRHPGELLRSRPPLSRSGRAGPSSFPSASAASVPASEHARLSHLPLPSSFLSGLFMQRLGERLTCHLFIALVKIPYHPLPENMAGEAAGEAAALGRSRCQYCPSHTPHASVSGIFPEGLANGNRQLLNCAKMRHVVLV